MKITREFYRPLDGSGYVKYEPNLEDCIGYKKDLFECWVKLTTDRPIAKFFKGKQSKPLWHYNFKNEEAMKKKINETISRLLSWEEMKEKRKEEKKKKMLNVKVGDLFVSSWGYEQTNVDFFQCTAVKGKTFTIKTIGGQSVDGSGDDYNGMADQVKPIKDAFIVNEHHPIMKKRSFRISSFRWLSPTTENETHYRSWYA